MQDNQGLYLIIALVGAILCGAIASSKGRSVVGWAIFGFLLPIIALIAAMFMKPGEKVDQPWQP